MLFSNEELAILNRLMMVFRNKAKEKHCMQKLCKKSSMQIVKNAFIYLCVMHKSFQVFFGIIDTRVNKM